MRTKNLIHPGEILEEEFLKPLGISQNRLATDIRVPAPRINAIVRGRRSITADTALRLGAYFGMEAQFWLNLQTNYDLGVASSGIWDKVKKLIPPFSRAAAM
jgi:addiction module HigA family antidote